MYAPLLICRNEKVPIGDTLKRKLVQQYQPMDIEIEEERGHYGQRLETVPVLEKWQNGNAPVLKTGIGNDV